MKEKAHRDNVEEEYTKVTTTAEFKSEFKYSHMDTIKKYSVKKTYSFCDNKRGHNDSCFFLNPSPLHPHFHCVLCF